MITTQYMNTQSIVFGTATGLSVPQVAIIADGACSPACRSAGMPFFSADWWCRFVLGGGTINAGVSEFSAEVCFIDTPGFIVMEGYDQSLNLIDSAITTVSGSQVLQVDAPVGQAISFIRIGGSTRPAGVSVDCLNFSPPFPLNPANCPASDHDCFVAGNPGCTDSPCCGLVCLILPSCCETAWDGPCISLAASFDLCTGDDPPPISCPNPDHDCFTTGTGGCSSESCCEVVCLAAPLCCLVAWDEVCVTLATEFCGGSSDCCSSHTGTGCDSVACESAVCAADPFCCNEAWDQICANEAEVLCPDLCGAAGVCPNPTHGCLEQGTPGCSDVSCCNAVCSIDPFCCVTSWDSVCAQSAITLCPDQCGGGACPNPTHSCFTVGTPGCDTPDCCFTVCTVDIFCCINSWDAECALVASLLCGCDNNTAPGVCGQSNAGPCTTPHETPGCNDCKCCNIVCLEDPFCCEAEWDTQCAEQAAIECDRCGDVNSGDCCVAHASPSCNDPECCCTVCNALPFCCTISWDQDCAAFAAAPCGDCTTCGSPSAGDCFTPGDTPGCDAIACCVAVCAEDSYCCEVAWDDLCVVEATLSCASNPTCDGATGSCFIVHTTAGCDQPGCCSLVCNVDPNCCGVEWILCASILPARSCEAVGCGEPGTASCFEAHNEPFCNDGACCDSVCNVDPFCCEETWDLVCVEEAESLCNFDPACPGSGVCFVAHANPGCNDSDCCNTVCTQDASCCSVEWDQSCALLAAATCPEPDVSAAGARSCFVASDVTSGCSDGDCALLVCAVDGYCCLVLWDSLCADEALNLCDGPSACGNINAGGCFMPNAAPGCNNADCCAIVCDLDPVCCTAAWDHDSRSSRSISARICPRVRGPATASSSTQRPGAMTLRVVKRCALKIRSAVKSRGMRRARMPRI